MPVFGKCCCCSLKIGNYVLGGLVLLGAVIQLGRYGKLMGQSQGVPANYIIDGILVPILWIIGSVFLLLGAFKDNATFVLVYLVCDGINILLTFISIIMVIAIGATHGVLSLVVTAIVFGVIILGVAVLIWLFPFSFYQELKEGGGGGGGSN